MVMECRGSRGRIILVGFALAGCHSSEMRAFRQELALWSGPQPHIALHFVDDNPHHDPAERDEVRRNLEAECRSALGTYSYVLDSTSPIDVVVHLTPGHPEPFRLVITSKTRGQLVDEPVENLHGDRMCELAVTRGLAVLQAENAPAPAETATTPDASAPMTAAAAAPTPSAAPIASTAGCSKDTDCKGDRICNAGVCESPPPPTTTSSMPKTAKH